MALVTGCGGKKNGEPKKEEAEPKKEEKPRDPITIVTTPGTTIQRDLKTKQKEWKISWEVANILLVEGVQSGKMKKVSGEIYEKDSVASTFTADDAEADKTIRRLNLSGNVVLTSVKPKAVLNAKKVEWLPQKKLFKASGAVTVTGDNGVIGPTETLFVSAKLDKVATSEDYFKK